MRTRRRVDNPTAGLPIRLSSVFATAVVLLNRWYAWEMPDRDALDGRLRALLRPVDDTGLDTLGADDWAKALAGVSRDRLMRAALAAVRELLMPGWREARPTDPRPERALSIAETWLDQRTDEAKEAAKLAAKGCTAARAQTLGYEHRVAEAARHVASAVGARDDAPLFDALVSVEEELFYRISIPGEYDRAAEQRRALVAVVSRIVLAPEPRYAR